MSSKRFGLSLLSFSRLSLCFLFISLIVVFFPTYANSVAYLGFSLQLLHAHLGTTYVCNLFVICLFACPYCNFTGLLLVCSSVFPGRLKLSLSASLRFPPFCSLLKGFMWVSLIVYIVFPKIKAVVCFEESFSGSSPFGI